MADKNISWPCETSSIVNMILALARADTCRKPPRSYTRGVLIFRDQSEEESILAAPTAASILKDAFANFTNVAQ